MSETLGIGEVAAHTRLRHSALRYYEAKGLIAPSGRIGGKRRYDRAVLRRLSLIRCAQAAGFTIPEIRKLLAGTAAGATPSKTWRELANRKLAEVSTLVRRAREMERWLREGLACDCVSIESCKLIRELTPAAPQAPPRARRPLQDLSERLKRRR
jgi:MerR family transcriptional regulator, redox-sensitive transcriptional activator SoxR